MDNNSTTPASQPATAPAPAPDASGTVPATPPTGTPAQGTNPPIVPGVAQAQTPPPGGSKKIMFVVVGLVLLIAIFAGVYWYMGQQANKTATQSQAVPSATPVADTIDSDLDAITVEELDADFATVDQDLQTL